MQVLHRLQGPGFRDACPSTRVLLAPATRDVVALPVFPQPPAPPSGASAAAGITWLPNPATFRLNEVRLRSQPHQLPFHALCLVQTDNGCDKTRKHPTWMMVEALR